MKRAIIVGLAALATMTQALAGEARSEKDTGPVGLGTEEASIPFLNQNAVINWQADGTHGLWVQDAHKQWYYAKTATACLGLDFAVQVGFRNRGINRLNRDSEVELANGTRCALISLKKSAPPPDGKRKSADHAH